MSDITFTRPAARPDARPGARALLSALIESGATRFTAWRARRRTYAVLARLPDEVLADIGLTPADLARGPAHLPVWFASGARGRAPHPFGR
ncbi:DUF1127 domain-containing protein [Propylenella binzhouense]|nr:DUF1127 domain-containing protein [Propylenella binzhouense]